MADPDKIRRLLIVDDDGPIRKFLAELFTGEGYVVTLATNGIEGPQAALNGDFDTIIVDEMMPYTIAGGHEDMAKTIAANGLRSSMVAISAQPKEQVDQARVERITNYLGPARQVRWLPKPFELNELIDTVAELVEHSSALSGGSDGSVGSGVPEARSNGYSPYAKSQPSWNVTHGTSDLPYGGGTLAEVF